MPTRGQAVCDVRTDSFLGFTFSRLNQPCFVSRNELASAATDCFEQTI